LLDATVVHALDFSAWKKAAVRQCFPGATVVFITRVDDAPADGVLVVWGLRPVVGELASNVKILRLEDGFLRSVGLGADLVRPMSWVVDRRGIYYDATRPSDLEHSLAETAFDRATLARAAALRERIVASGVTKYNVGVISWQRPTGTGKVILVPGQVESDASLAYGAPKICSNIGLLRSVRQANPQEYIVYKPHPDVVAGLRAKGEAEDEALRWCNELVTDAAMGDLLMAVDEVHVLTSLTGFEALLRRKPVTCYGQPFYSGWGLTTDVVPNLRRGRRLSLDELVAGALINYPLYLSRLSNALITPEQALDELLAWRGKAGGSPPWWRRWFRVILRRIVGVR
jgi:capsular polysaccharide export protein